MTGTEPLPKKRGFILDWELSPYTNSIFQQPWWLEAVAQGHWDEIMIKRDDGAAARLPYAIRKKYGLTLMTMPRLTHTLGPYISPVNVKEHTRLANEKELMLELIKRLPPHDFFLQKFHYSIQNWMPFFWNGFEQTTHYTFLIEDLSDLDRLWDAMSPKVRNRIRKAEKSGIKVEETDDIDTLLELNEKTFMRQGLALSYSPEYLRRLNRACERHGAGKIFIAYGPDGKPHTGIFCVHDERSTYNLILGSDPELRKSGAIAKAIWESIIAASKTSKAYDFEGTMMEPVEKFLRGFGAVHRPYFQVTGKSRRMEVLLSGRKILKALFRL